MLAAFALAYLFYESVPLGLLVAPFGLAFLRVVGERKAGERRWRLNLQFADGLSALLGALNAGYSVENAFLAAWKELRLMYAEGEPILTEFERIGTGLRMGQTIEALLLDLGQRSQVEDIEMFAEVFSICKRTGGDLMGIVEDAMDTIRDKVELKRQIRTVMSAKRLEARIMAVVPLGIVAYMKVFSGGLLEPLYHNLLGQAIMTGLLVAYAVAYGLAERIASIEV